MSLKQNHKPNCVGQIEGSLISCGEHILVQGLENSCSLSYDEDDVTAKKPAEDLQKAVTEASNYVSEKSKNLLGYQASQKVELPQLATFLDKHVNNIGDTYAEGGFRCSNKFMERAVVKYYSEFWKAPVAAPAGESTEKIDDNEAWGHILTMGCTEGNMYALRNARDYLQGKYSTPECKHKSHSTATKTPCEYKSCERIVNTRGIKISEEQYKVLEELHSEYESISAFAESLAVKPSSLDPKAYVYSEDLPKVLNATQKRSYQDTVNKKAKEPVMLYSESSHYSFGKIKDMLDMCSPADAAKLEGFDSQGVEMPEKIPIHIDGTIDIPRLVEIVRVLVSNDYPFIINANFGTTFTGAYDSPIEIYHALNNEGLLKEYHWVEEEAASGVHLTEKKVVHVCAGYVRPNFWIHVDGALGGAFGSLFDKNDDTLRKKWSTELGIPLENIPKLPTMDFRHNGGNIKFGPVMSIAMSGHKILGAPIPTGIFMTLRKYTLDFNVVTYIGTADTTLAGSRSAFGALAMWGQVAKSSLLDYAERFITLEKLAAEAEEELGKVNKHVYRAPNALSIIFPMPRREIVDEFSLSTDKFKFPGTNEAQEVAHIFIMPHVKKETIQRLCKKITERDSLKTDRANPPRTTSVGAF